MTGVQLNHSRNELPARLQDKLEPEFLEDIAAMGHYSVELVLEQWRKEQKALHTGPLHTLLAKYQIYDRDFIDALYDVS